MNKRLITKYVVESLCIELEKNNFQLIDSNISGREGSFFNFQRSTSEEQAVFKLCICTLSSGKLEANLSVSFDTFVKLKKDAGINTNQESERYVSSVNIRDYLSAKNGLRTSIYHNLDELWITNDELLIPLMLDKFLEDYLLPALYKFTNEMRSWETIDGWINPYILKNVEKSKLRSWDTFPHFVHFRSVQDQMAVSLISAWICKNLYIQQLHEIYSRWIELETRMYRIKTSVFKDYMLLSKYLVQ
jgi:hypothetical protein